MVLECEQTKNLPFLYLVLKRLAVCSLQFDPHDGEQLGIREPDGNLC
jgi:hypothetical protein